MARVYIPVVLDIEILGGVDAVVEALALGAEDDGAAPRKQLAVAVVMGRGRVVLLVALGLDYPLVYVTAGARSRHHSRRRSRGGRRRRAVAAH